MALFSGRVQVQYHVQYTNTCIYEINDKKSCKVTMTDKKKNKKIK